MNRHVPVGKAQLKFFHRPLSSLVQRGRAERKTKEQEQEQGETRGRERDGVCMEREAHENRGGRSCAEKAHQGCQVPFRPPIPTVGLLLRRCSGKGLHVAMTGDPRGFSRVAAGSRSSAGSRTARADTEFTMFSRRVRRGSTLWSTRTICQRSSTLSSLVLNNAIKRRLSQLPFFCE